MAVQKEDLSMFVPAVHFELIPIKNLVSNQEYQRMLSIKHVQRAAANFDLYQINPVKVSRRDGINFVFNGQHTIEIVAMVSGSRETPVWCMIYEDLEYQAEADIFANQMKYVKPLAPYEIFMANIEAGNDKQLIIRDLVESYGLSITRSSVPGGICAISTLESIYDRFGFQILERVIRLCVSAWEGEAQSLSAAMLNAVAKLVVCYGEQLKEETFKEKLSNVPVKTLIRSAKERRGGTRGYAEAILIEYNKRMRIQLPWDWLYKSKNPHIQNAVEIEDSNEEESIIKAV